MSGGQEEPPFGLTSTVTLSEKAGDAIDGLTRKRRSEPKNMLNRLLNWIT
jgi:hypothetical protein